MESIPESFYEQSDSEEETIERILAILKSGGSVRLNIGDDVSAETAKHLIETLREAGADVIIPSEN